MPYKSAAQMRFMHSQHPEIAKKWDKEIKSAGKNFPKGTRAEVTHHSPSKLEYRKMADPMEKSHGASPGGEDDSEKMEKEEGQTHTKGGGPKILRQPSIEDGNDEALAMRGMSSEEGAKHWKTTGYKVPKSQGEDHTKRK